eukprot:1085306-Amphidinium_carterae.1
MSPGATGRLGTKRQKGSRRMRASSPWTKKGVLKLKRSEISHETDVHDGYLARLALHRRALAFDFNSLCSFATMELFHDQLFNHLYQQPSPG